ncbi:MAG: hypothetical protein WCD60_08695, partial [Pseudolabrys sp.]
RKCSATARRQIRSAGPGEVVVDVYAASVNAADSKVRQGGGRYTLNQFPHIFGRDFCVNKITLPRASLAAAGSQD